MLNNGKQQLLKDDFNTQPKHRRVSFTHTCSCAAFYQPSASPSCCYQSFYTCRSVSTTRAAHVARNQIGGRDCLHTHRLTSRKHSMWVSSPFSFYGTSFHLSKDGWWGKGLKRQMQLCFSKILKVKNIEVFCGEESISPHFCLSAFSYVTWLHSFPFLPISTSPIFPAPHQVFCILTCCVHNRFQSHVYIKQFFMLCWLFNNTLKTLDAVINNHINCTTHKRKSILYASGAYQMQSTSVLKEQRAWQ